MGTRLIVPHADITGFSHAGVEYKVDGGTIEVPDHAVARALEMGFKTHRIAAPYEIRGDSGDGAELDIENMGRRDLLAYAENNKLTVPDRASTGDLRKLVAEHAAAAKAAGG